MEEEPPLTQVATAATTAAPSDISVTFSQAGPLGIHLGSREGSSGILARHGYPNGIKPGTQAEQHPQLRAGLVVTSVNGTWAATLTAGEVFPDANMASSGYP